MRRFPLAHAAMLGVLLAAGCGSGIRGQPAPDVPVDDTADAEPGTIPDAAVDMPTDPDAGLDIPDAGADAGTDALADTVSDALVDSAPDAVPDASPDTLPDALVDTLPDAAPDATVRTCRTLADCEACELCVANRCVAPAEAPCRADDDCPGDWVCALHSDDPCRNRCTPPPECGTDEDCGPCEGCIAGDCAVVQPAPCLVDGDCGRAYACAVDAEAPCRNACVFVPECAVDGDCGPCEGCVLGTCVQTVPAPCVVDGDCGEARRCATEPGAPCHSRCEPDPGHPLNIFGSKYWNVYRPHFLATHYENGRVCDRLEGGTKMWGDNTLWMGYALTTFANEYRAWPNPGTLGILHQILNAYEALEVLDGDPYDGYVVRSDRGPDYTSNWYTRDNEPSGDQVVSTLRGLLDVVTHPGALVHEGVDLKQMARNRAAWLGYRLKANDWRLRNQAGQRVKRGDDQRWASWAFQQGAGRISGLGAGVFESSWTVDILGVPVAVGPQYHRGITRQFIAECFSFTSACVSGQAIDLGIGYTVNVACNEFNIGLGGDFATIGLGDDPSSPDWFSAVVNRQDIIDEGNAMWAMVARYRFNDLDPGLHETAKRCFSAPDQPPRGDNQDPNGWCRSWRWAHDFDDPDRCTAEPAWFQTFSGLDYLLCRALASAHGDFLPASDWD